MRYRPFIWFLRASALMIAIPSSAPAQTGPDSAVYVIALGRDTTRVEWSVREGNRLRIFALTRAAVPAFVHYTVTLAADGAIEQMDVFDSPGWGGVAGVTPRARIRVEADSTTEERFRDGPARLVTPGRTHVYNSGGTAGLVFSMLPPLAALAPPDIGSSVVGQHVAGTFGARPYLIRRDAPNVVTMGSSLTGMMRVRFDSAGRAVQIDAMGSSFNVVADRTHWLDPDSVSRALAEMERVRPLAAIAPRDSAQALLDGGRVQVEYSRPAKRGRLIFGGIVPWNVVWRTGANLATHLRTERTLVFGDAVIAPGEYTLWTLPTPDGWTLIINGQIGQWGTDYDRTHDVARVPMHVRTLSEPVERFTIRVDARDGGGVLLLIWDTMEASALFDVRSTEGSGTGRHASPSL